MPPKTKEIYSLFVKNHSLISSVDEILYFKQLWPLKEYVEEKVNLALPHLEKKKYHMGLDISSRSTGLCILDSNRIDLWKYMKHRKCISLQGNSSKWRLQG